MHRPLHIGRLSVKLTPGVFVFDDVLIEGLEPRPPPVPQGPEDRDGAPVVVHLHAEADHRVGRDDRLGHAHRDVAVEPRLPQRTSQLSEVHQGLEIDGAEAFHDDAAKHARLSRQLHLRRPRHAVERGGARSAHLAGARRGGHRVPGPGVVQRFDDHHPEVRALPREHAVAVHHRRIGSFTSAGSISPAKGRSRCSPATSTWAAGPNRPIRSHRRSIFRRRRTSSSIATTSSSRARETSTARSTCSREDAS